MEIGRVFGDCLRDSKSPRLPVAKATALGRECGRGARPMPRQFKKNKKGKQTMKLTKADIKDVRAKLAAKLIEIDRAKKEKDSLEARLARPPGVRGSYPWG